MLNPGHVITPESTLYLYDGTLEGFYCCVFHSVYQRETPAGIVAAYAAQPTLYREKPIPTDGQKAARVGRSIPLKMGYGALEMVETVFLSCMPQKEMALLSFLLLGYKTGPGVMRMLAHPAVAPLLRVQRNVNHEAHLLSGFIRFSDYDGMLCATITPKNYVLPILQEHFCARLSTERFLIFDKTHKAALIYQNGQARTVGVDNINFAPPSASEEHYRALWKQFYNTIAIKGRENPRCRMSHMPKRFWENMTEMKDLL